MLEHRIAQLEERLLSARVITKKEISKDTVSVGAHVRLRDVEANKTVEYHIVGSAEANPAENKLSNESPVGKAIIGHKKGESVEVSARAARSSSRSSRSRPPSPRRAARRIAARCLCRNVFPTASRSRPSAPRPKGSSRARSAATRRLAGRVMARRDMGKLAFLDLVDRSGRIQLLVREEKTGTLDLDLGDVIGVSGIPARTKKGEPSLAVETLELLAKNRKPLPDTFHGLQDVETRYRQRYLDLLVGRRDHPRGRLRSSHGRRSPNQPAQQVQPGA